VRPIGTIEHHPQSGQRAHSAKRRASEGQIVCERLRCRADAPDVAPSRCRACHPLADHLLEMVLLRIGELETVSREEFNAVVGEGIMRGREHDPAQRPPGPCQISDRWCRQDTYPDGIDSGRTNAGADGRLQHVPGEPCITSDDDRPLALAGALQIFSPGTPQGERHFWRHRVVIRQAAHTIGAEETAFSNHGFDPQW
jgi:hypothetical protein